MRLTCASVCLILTLLRVRFLTTFHIPSEQLRSGLFEGCLRLTIVNQTRLSKADNCSPELQLCDYATYRHILTIGQEFNTITYDYAHHQLISGIFKLITDPCRAEYLVNDEPIVSVANPLSNFHFQ